MDDQARRAPKKTDQTMAEAFGKCWGNHSSFKVGLMDQSGYSTFAVRHFNGPVTYSSENVLKCNLNTLNPNFISLLHGSNSGATDTVGAEESGSINPFVKGLFSAKAIVMQAHLRNEDTIVTAQQPMKPMRAPSTRGKRTIKRMTTLREGGDEKEDEETPVSGGIPCVAGDLSH